MRATLRPAGELKELKADLFTEVSHEVRNPLTIILSSAELLENYGQNWSEEKKRQHLQRIKLAAQQLNEMFSEALALSCSD